MRPPNYSGLIPRSASIFTSPSAQRIGLPAARVPNLRIPVVTWEQNIQVFAGGGGGGGGGNPFSSIMVWMRDDPLLRGYARYTDERTFWEMREREIIIANSIGAVNRSMLARGHGFRTERSRRSAPAAKKVKQFLEAAFKAIPNLHTFLEVASNVVWEGWMPWQIWWRPDAFTWNGRSYYGVDQIFEMPQPLFGVTPDRNLAWLGFTITQPYAEVLTGGDPVESLGWDWGNAGGARSPYGRAVLSRLWLYYYLKQKNLEFYQRGVRNALQGIPVFKNTMAGAFQDSGMRAGLAGDAGGAEMAQFEVDVRRAIRVMEEQGVVIVSGGMDFDTIHFPSSVVGWESVLNYLDRQLQIGIEGQHLTSAEGEHGGNRALGEVQERTKMEVVAHVARHVEPSMNRLARKIIEVNLGPEAFDPEDIPIWRFRIVNEFSWEKAKAFTDMGGILDAQEMADDAPLPMVTGDDPPGPVLKLQQPAPMLKTAVDGDKEAGPGLAPTDPQDAGADGGSSGAAPKPGSSN